MRKVPCNFYGCSGRRNHHESDSPESGRPHRTVEIPDDFRGKVFCSLECQMYYEGTKNTIPKSLIPKVAEFLGEKGVHYFKTIQKIHKRVNPVLRCSTKHGSVFPHPIHFREGMQIRNFLREQDECKDWDQHDLDNKWSYVIEMVIEENT